MNPGDPSTSLRCAVRHAAEGVDPGGTAPHWDAVLVVEVPAPWPWDISEAEPFRSLCDAPSATITGADGRIWRPQAVLPAEPVEGVRVMAREAAGQAAGLFELREWLLPPGSPDLQVQLCAALLGSDEPTVARFSMYRDDPAPGTVDLLLCTHGTRDVCCGGSGTSLHAAAVSALDAQPVLGFRLWRSSHAGGHRFAPTGMSFPDGVSWSHLDLHSLLEIASRETAGAALPGHVRGAVSVDGAQAQVADREGFRAHGWDWFGASREVTVVSESTDSCAATVEVSATLPGGERVGVRVAVELAGRIPQPPCGVAEPSEVPEEPVWRVAGSVPLPRVVEPFSS
jgi:hypothetical protein